MGKLKTHINLWKKEKGIRKAHFKSLTLDAHPKAVLNVLKKEFG